MLPSLPRFLAPDTGLSLNVYWPPRPGSCLCPSGLVSPVMAHPYPSLLPSAGSVRAQTASAAPVSLLPHPISVDCSHTPTFKCLRARISQTFCVLSRGSLVRYSCSPCYIFKGSDLEVLSGHHGADVTKKFY